MRTLPGGRPPAGQDGPGHHDGVDIIRMAMLFGGGAIGAILAIVLLSTWKDTGASGSIAITTIGTIVGAVVGVAALEGRRRGR